MNSKDLSARDTLKLLEKLTSGVRAFAEREKGIDRARQLRDSSQRQSIEEQRIELEKEHRSAVDRVREVAAAECEVVAQVY